MAHVVRCGLIQLANPINDESVPVAEIQQAMLEKHLPYIDEAGEKGVQILCLQEIFNGPYFCPSQSTRWYEAAEPIPGPTTEIMAEYARKHEMVIVVPLYEEAMRGVYYNSAAVIDADLSRAAAAIALSTAACARGGHPRVPTPHAERVRCFAEMDPTDAAW